MCCSALKDPYTFYSFSFFFEKGNFNTAFNRYRVRKNKTKINNKMKLVFKNKRGHSIRVSYFRDNIRFALLLSLTLRRFIYIYIYFFQIINSEITTKTQPKITSFSFYIRRQKRKKKGDFYNKKNIFFFRVFMYIRGLFLEKGTIIIKI